MRKTLIAALIVTAGVATQAIAQHIKQAEISFALNDQYQYRVYDNNVLATNTLPAFFNCADTIKYTSAKQKVDTKRVIGAIGDAYGEVFTTKAKLTLWYYENEIKAPPYPPYLIAPYYNGPRDGMTDAIIDPMLIWPNEAQIDWVEYDTTGEGTIVNWPKAWVYISDVNNADPDLRCVDVTPFFSIEESYCYFCWDTVDRVTDGSITLGTTTGGDICIGATTTCGTKGSGTTRFYLSVKFNNTINNIWLSEYYTDIPVIIPEPDRLNVANVLIFTVNGIVSYKWSYKALDSGAGVVPFGTMTMSQAGGYGAIPWCGHFSGSLKITEVSILSDNAPECLGFVE